MVPRLVALALSLVLVVGCGGGPAPTSPKEPSARSVPTAPTTTAAAMETTSLKRSQVKRAIGLGLGALLQHVTVDDMPAFKDGKFQGFRIKDMDPEWNVGLRPGDVVMRVNGMVIEHPEEADAALRALEKSDKLRIDIERDGKPKTIELPIVPD